MTFIPASPVWPSPRAAFPGPLCHHIAVRMVWEVAQAVDIPINGVGGVMTGEDAAEFILAGATCVSVGMANFVDQVRLN